MAVQSRFATDRHGLAGAFVTVNNPTEHHTMAKATARHILVEDEAACGELKTRIEAGEDFAALAKEHSKCPSGRDGGNLGEFGPGMMVKEFDTVVFNEAVGEVHGPVKTQFGYHLLEITSRTD